MQEVEIEQKELELKVYINGKPEIKNMPSEILESFISLLQLQITEEYNKKINKK